MSTLSWWGEDVLGRGGNDTIWAHGGNVYSFGRMRSEVYRLRDLYRHQGVSERCSVVLHGTPSFTQLWSLFALWALGARVLFVEQGVSRSELESTIRKTRPEFWVSSGGLGRAYRPFRDEDETMIKRLPGGLPATSDHCLVQLSSGTTGRSKLIGRTGESLLAEVDRITDLDTRKRPGESVLLLDSWARSFGLIGGVLCAADRAATLTVCAGLTSPRALQALAAASVIIGAPQHFEALANAPDTVVLPQLRLALSGGEALPTKVFELFAHRYGVRIGNVYGTTETGVVAADLYGELGPPYIGWPVAGLRTRIKQSVLQVHLTQSPYLHEDSDEDDEALRDGWISTQDLADRDPVSGVLRLRGRIDTENTAAYANIDLIEIEQVLQAHHDVRQAIVLGVDTIEAHVSGPPTLDPDDLIEWCRKLLGEARTPARCHVVPELLRTSNGKLLRNRELIRSTHAARPD